MTINVDAWLKRAAEFQLGRGGNASAGEALQFAISMATTFYGPTSPQVQMITRRADAIPKDKNNAFTNIVIYEFSYGCIKNMAAEISAGLVQNIRLGIAGEILADLIGLARDALNSKAISVAAVLTAAAFEDLMRRLALEKAGVTSRPKLEEVIRELKDKAVLQGGEPGVAQSFLKFRNDSLHADWSKVTESQVTSCLGLLDTLIVKHLS